MTLVTATGQNTGLFVPFAPKRGNFTTLVKFHLEYRAQERHGPERGP